MLFVNHCHVFPESPDLEANLGIIGTLDRLVDTMKKCGIGKAVAFAPFEEWGWRPSIGESPNHWLAEKLQSYPEIVGFACINPKSSEAVKELERARGEGLLGVKLHPAIHKFRLNDTNIFPFYRKAEELGMLLDFHTGSHGWRLLEYQPLLLDDVAFAFPDLRIVIEHVGGRHFYGQALALLMDKKNVYAGISSCLDEGNKSWFLGPAIVEEIASLVGPDRMIYGTDFPYNDWRRTRRDIEIIRSLDLPESAKERILGGSLEGLLKDAQQG